MGLQCGEAGVAREDACGYNSGTLGWLQFRAFDGGRAEEGCGEGTKAMRQRVRGCRDVGEVGDTVVC